MTTPVPDLDLTPEECCAIEAGLRLIQNALDGEGLPPAIGKVFTGFGAHEGLTPHLLDQLIDRVINHKGDLA